jgi:hypothetical protein
VAFAERTSVSVDKTRQEIERLLAKYKASQYGTAIDYERLTARLQFKLNHRVIRFELYLPDPKKLRGEKHAQEDRRIWRALLLIVKAKLEAVGSGITTFEDEFLAHIVMPNDQTVGRVLQPLVEGAYKTGRMPKALLPEAGGGEQP